MTTELSSLFELWCTPTISLSLVIESERPEPTWLRSFSRFALYFRPLLRPTLEYEISQRGSASNVISATTLRVVDSAHWRSIQSRDTAHGSSALSEELAGAIAAGEGIPDNTSSFTLLDIALKRVLLVYDLVEEVEERKRTPVAEDESGNDRLRELWGLLKPDSELESLKSKQWQEIGFQGSDPRTDFRGLGSLALDCLLHFAKTHEHRAVEVVDEAVNGGENWYPLSIAMMHMTAYALELAVSRDLQLMLLRSYQTPPDASSDRQTGIEPFLTLTSDLLLLFHSHWLRGDYTVMQFEQVAKAFKLTLTPWIRRGIMDSRAWTTGDPIKLE